MKTCQNCGFQSVSTNRSICKKCGVTAVFDKATSIYTCPMCKDNEVVNVDMSYAFKLLLDELKSMIIYPKLDVGE